VPAPEQRTFAGAPKGGAPAHVDALDVALSLWNSNVGGGGFGESSSGAGIGIASGLSADEREAVNFLILLFFAGVAVGFFYYLLKKGAHFVVYYLKMLPLLILFSLMQGKIMLLVRVAWALLSNLPLVQRLAPSLLMLPVTAVVRASALASAAVAFFSPDADAVNATVAAAAAAAAAATGT
jgi:hypothetical protein